MMIDALIKRLPHWRFKHGETYCEITSQSKGGVCESIFTKSVGEKVCLLLIEFCVMEYSVIVF